jgi:putative ABC transport system permease protein
MTLANLLHLYRVRVRARILQECFAVLGIAAGVALLFASQIASQSLSSSVAQLSRGIVGNATLQLLARGPDGFDQTVLTQVRRAPGVRVAAPLLEAEGQALGPRGSRSVELVGADESLKQLGGALVRHSQLSTFGGVAAILLPTPLARSIGVTKFEAEATLEVGGHVSSAPLYSQLGAKQIGPLVNSPIVVAPLSYAQEASGLPGRVTRVLVAPAPGQQASVRAALERIAGGRLTVQNTGYDERLFTTAASASNQSTVLFAVISAIVGFLFAFNAMLLTVPQRRRLIGDLRRDGYTPRAALGVLALDVLVLGAAGCALGLILGDELSIHLFRSNPGYLSSAFSVGTSRVISARSALIAAAGGMLAAAVAVLGPLRDTLARGRPAALLESEDPVSPPARWLAAAGVACVAAAVAVLLAAPSLAIVGMLALICGLLLLIPFALGAALALLALAARAVTSAIPHVASMELRASGSRAVAIAATGAVAVFGSVSIQGAHADVQHGLEDAAHDMNAFTDFWISPAGSFDLLMTEPFPSTSLGRLRGLAGVRAVRVYRGGLLDWGSRRTWVIAPPAQSSPLIPPSQLLEGSLARADEWLRGGGWAVLSKALADEHRLHVGESFVVPAPHPLALRLAAISTNIGWPPGALIMNGADYARAWESSQPSAYDVLLKTGASPARVRRELERALGPSSGLVVQSAVQHAETQRTLTRQGLQRLTQIATLILAAAILAMGAAIAAMIWQRRPRLAKLKLEGFSPLELWLTILLESLVLIAVGCLSGALVGLLGQQLLDRALAAIVNFPVVGSVALPDALVSVLAVTAAAAAILAIPGRLAVRVEAGLALQD